MAFTVVLRPQAEEDLAAIYEYIAQSNPQRAIEYLRRLRLRCEALTNFPERGRARDDLMPGARMLPFDRSAVIIYRIEGDVVRIIDIFYRGRNYEAILRGEASDNE
jgi:toxin ParE1/3/4